MSEKVRSFSSARVPLTGNPRNFQDPDANKSTGESLQDRVARLEREKVQRLLDFAAQAQAAKRQEAAYVPLRSAAEEEERRARQAEMREMLCDGLITQEDYDQFRRAEAAEVEKERLEFEKQMRDAVAPEPKDWYLRFLLRTGKGDVEWDEKKLKGTERRRLARYKAMLKRARLPEEHALFLNDFMPESFKDQVRVGKKIEARNEQLRKDELERQGKADIEGPPPPPQAEVVKTEQEPMNTSVVPGFTPPLFKETTSRGNEKYFETWTGQWKKGWMHGSGRYTFRDHSTYDGEIRASRPHGKGKATFDDGSVYEGEFRNGNFHGQGKMVFRNGMCTYEGEWVDGRRQGFGIQTFASGQRYEGEFRDGDYHGMGTLESSTGNKYHGRFSHGLIEGYGSLDVKGDRERLLQNGVVNPQGIYQYWPRMTLRQAVMAVKRHREEYYTERRTMWRGLMAPLQEKALQIRTQKVKDMRSVELLEQLQALKNEQRRRNAERRALVEKAAALARGEVEAEDLDDEELDDIAAQYEDLSDDSDDSDQNAKAGKSDQSDDGEDDDDDEEEEDDGEEYASGDSDDETDSSEQDGRSLSSAEGAALLRGF